MFSLLLWIVAAIPHDGHVARERCDVIELQNFWSPTEEEGWPLTHKFVLAQALFWDWDGQKGEHVLRAWRMAKQEVQELDESGLAVGPPPRWNMELQFSHARQLWEFRWWDGNVQRVVSAKTAHVTADEVDRELLNRVLLPHNERRELIPADWLRPRKVRP